MVTEHKHSSAEWNAAMLEAADRKGNGNIAEPPPEPRRILAVAVESATLDRRASHTIYCDDGSVWVYVPENGPEYLRVPDIPGSVAAHSSDAFDPKNAIYSEWSEGEGGND